jgi:DNA polymerase elongation subunit (family B)
MSDFYTFVDQRFGKILIRGYDDGKQYIKKYNYEPELFVPSDLVSAKSSKHKSLIGSKPLTKRSFKSIREAGNFAKENSLLGIYNQFPNKYKYIASGWKDGVDYDTSLIRIINFDIEVMLPPEGGFPYPETANGEINAITIYYDDVYYVFGTQSYTPKQPNVKYMLCQDEKDLLKKFVNMWSCITPDIITGWNIEFFDVPYIINRTRKIVGEEWANKLSPWGNIDERKIIQFGRESIVYDILGVVTLDYVSLYKKFTYNQRESYTLNNISHEELGEKKLDYSEHETLFKLYEKDFEKFIDYNIKDVELVKKLDDKLRLFDLVFMIAYTAKCNLRDVLGTLKMWEVICYNYLYNRNIMISPKSKIDEREFVGGYVKDPKTGRHKWIVSFDLTSMYPHLLMQYNISPETMRQKINIDIEKLIDKSEVIPSSNDSLAANGVFYSNESQGFIPDLMEKFFLERKKVKSEMIEASKRGDIAEEVKLNTRQMAIKILLNSLYGALGNKYFRFFSADMAESVTTSGQLSIRWIERKLNEFMNFTLKTEDVDYVVAIDTDSVYMTFDSLVDKVFDKGTPNTKILDFLDEISSGKIEPFITESYEELAEYMNAYKQKMFMGREVISDSSVFIAKKRYIMNVLDNEGVRYKEPKIKMMGVEAVRSSTPAICRKTIKEMIKIILNGTEKEAQDFIKETKHDFFNSEFVDIAFPRTANNIDKFRDPATLFVKGTPIHIRGSLLYNFAIDETKLKDKYEPIENGTKIKFCYLKMPNPLKSNVVSAASVLPKELNLDAYIDYQLQFEKAFLQPVQGILNLIKWKTEKQTDLTSFFT